MAGGTVDIFSLEGGDLGVLVSYTDVYSLNQADTLLGRPPAAVRAMGRQTQEAVLSVAELVLEGSQGWRRRPICDQGIRRP